MSNAGTIIHAPNSSADAPPRANGDAKTRSGEARPSSLYAVMAPLGTLKGVGGQVAAVLKRLLNKPEPRVLDLLFLNPTGRRDVGIVEDLKPDLVGHDVTLDVLVEDHRAAPPGTKAPYKVNAVTSSGVELELVFFRGKRPYLERTFPEGAELRIIGKLARYQNRWSIAHPEVLGAEGAGQAAVLYPLSEGLTQGRLRGLMANAIETLPELPEWLDPRLVAAERLPSFREALAILHGLGHGHDGITNEPGDVEESLEAEARARRRLALDELFAMQLSLALVRAEHEAKPGSAWLAPGVWARRLQDTLPFALTPSQARAIEGIRADLASDKAMMRLLMGDVGSGKTLVALASMLHVAESGAQTVLMAPTEVLARQHHAGLSALCAPLGVEPVLLTGQDPAPVRRRALEAIGSGRARLVVGTHALFQSGVSFRRLGLAVIDEQHRFGVHQRLDLVGKGGDRAVDLLLMTATPIPRSLVMSLYGDVATSKLTELPAGRQPIDTAVVAAGRRDEVAQGLRRVLDRGERVYWVCPAVEPGDDPKLPAATARFEWLRGLFGDRVGLVHGKLPAAQKEARMNEFKAGRTDLLVATTVIEVGVDVPEATTIVIEGAERFGLAQLHQLRGRVGRGDKPSTCLLLYQPPLGAVAKARLKTLRETRDGFAIAEEDLRLRGPGEVLGVRQSGLPEFSFADLVRDQGLMEQAQAYVKVLMAEDPELNGGHGSAARTALHLFAREEAVRLLQAG